MCYDISSFGWHWDIDTTERKMLSQGCRFPIDDSRTVCDGNNILAVVALAYHSVTPNISPGCNASPQTAQTRTARWAPPLESLRRIHPAGTRFIEPV